MRLSRFIVAVYCASAAGCAGDRIAPSEEGRPVPLYAVLNQMKCELARAFTKIDRDRLSFSGWLIDGKLTAKIITSQKVEGNIGTPELVPIGSGTSVGFSLSGSVTRSRTSDTVLDFVVSPIATSTAICSDPGDPSVRKVGSLGIYDWLASISATRSGQPLFAPTNLVYVLDFGVKREGGGSLDVAIVPIKATAKANASRDDIQHLELTFSPGAGTVKEVKRVIRTAAKPTTVKAPGEGNGTVRIRNLPGAVTTNDSSSAETQENRILK